MIKPHKRKRVIHKVIHTRVSKIILELYTQEKKPSD